MEQYIPKTVVVAEIEKRIKEHHSGYLVCLKDMLSFLDTLEVKEVDFESEWKKYFEYRGDVATVNIKHLAKHFFELGIKAQKGE